MRINLINLQTAKCEIKSYLPMPFNFSVSGITEMFMYSENKMQYMDVISFRIPKDLKKSMKEIDVNWSEEIRKFIEAKVREKRRNKALEEIDAMLSGLPGAEKGKARNYVRADRDSN